MIQFRPTSLLSAVLLPALALAACSAPPVSQSDANLTSTNEVDAISVIDEPQNAAAPVDANALSAAGLGALRIGMTKAEVVAAMGESSGGANAEPEACEQFHPVRAPEGVLVMLEQGKLTRISLIRDAAVKTDAGLGLGAPAAAIKTKYGTRAVSTPHKYVAAPAEYITIWNNGSGGPGSLGIVYEIGEAGTVTAIHAGGPAIQYVEGCA